MQVAGFQAVLLKPSAYIFAIFGLSHYTMNKIRQILPLPYPVSKSTREILASSLFIAVASYLFITVFQPFGTATFDNPYKYLLLLPYSIIPFLAFAVAGYLIKRRKWTFSKEMIKILCTLLVCALINYWYAANFINYTSFDLSDMVHMIYYSFAIGVPVCFMDALGRYIYLTMRHSVRIEPAIENTTADGRITIRPDSGTSVLSLAKSDFLFAESEGNYSTVYHLANGQPAKALMRLSLKNLEEQLDSDDIVRCHRSFIVNLNHVKTAKGNAQGYKLHMGNLAGTVPVSRKYLDTFQKQAPALCHS